MSTCHWCHVMAEESFENEEVAAILNQHALYPPKEIVCVMEKTQKDPDLSQLKKYMASHYEPNRIVLVKNSENQEELQSIVDYIKDYHTIDGKTTYYICENHSCKTVSSTV
ncbi:DUF255 domain-containing protein [Herbinix luporum]|uniref:Spermatogenesis-associated protein 20-like TRX domain-containing protein n=1 Tax=Herbinix luporum TaxID=1679721 RepID=A0A0K8J3C4_9FIRM|nr:DUF255 domain-containing protein [Herbinix luporum]CUH91823.1 hypothetical protein SD1D_0270 [Herbinix luporum]